MTSIAYQRIHNQHLSSTEFKKPADLVKWMGAVQAQDYYGAKWALAQRMKDAIDETIEKAFANGDILRTHVMRPTWHFVTPADIRWLLKLTAPRVNAACSHNYRKFELDASVFKRTNKVLAGALRNGRQLTRQTLRTAVERAGIAADNLIRFIHILIRAELDEVICSGARKGKQFTWSGLDLVQRQLAKEVIDNKTYWLPSAAPVIKPASRTLLPTFSLSLTLEEASFGAMTTSYSIIGHAQSRTLRI